MFTSQELRYHLVRFSFTVRRSSLFTIQKSEVQMSLSAISGALLAETRGQDVLSLAALRKLLVLPGRGPKSHKVVLCGQTMDSHPV